MPTRREWLCLAASGFLVLTSRTGWAEIPGKSRAALAFQEWHGTFGGSPEKWLRTVTRSDDWQRVWRGLSKPEPARFVDGVHGAVIADLGSRPTGGYGISAMSAEISDKDVRLVVAEVVPGKDRVVIQAFTQPWAVFLLEARGRALNATWQDA